MVTLRPAVANDADRLYRWRVDPETVRQSIAPPPASLDEHRAWLEATLSDPRVSLFVAHDDQRSVDVGMVRIARQEAGEAELSIAVAPDERGLGYAHHLIAAAIQAAGGVAVVARVKHGNVRSLRAFRALGFREEQANGGELVRLIHRPAAAAGAKA